MTQQLTAQIRLPYFKQGDDMQSCLAHDKSGKVDVKSSILAHIDLLKAATQQLKDIHESLPDDGEYTLHADTHYIGLTGPENVINNLVNKELASIEEDWDEKSDDNSSEDDKNDDDSDTDTDPFDPNNVEEDDSEDE